MPLLSKNLTHPEQTSPVFLRQGKPTHDLVYLTDKSLPSYHHNFQAPDSASENHGSLPRTDFCNTRVEFFDPGGPHYLRHRSQSPRLQIDGQVCQTQL